MFDQKLPPVKTLEPPGDQPACKDPKSKTKDNAVNVDFQHLRGLFSLTWKKMLILKTSKSEQLMIFVSTQAPPLTTFHPASSTK